MSGVRARAGTLLILSLASSVAAGRAAAATDAAAAPADLQVQVALDAAGQSGEASATVRIHARPEVVWGLITSCAEELKIVPGLVLCQVEKTAADGSQLIRHVLNYSWYEPRLNYLLRATYQKPERVSIERVSGDLRRLSGSWTLVGDGDFTEAHYAVTLVPGFWVPNWLIRSTLQRDLPKMLRALRERAETAAAGQPG